MLYLILKKNHTSIILEHKWNTNLNVDLSINHKTNKIKTNNINGLIEYLQNHVLALKCYCQYCCTSTLSSDLSFDFKNMFLLATTIGHEDLILDDKDKLYLISTSNTQSHVMVVNSNISFELPPLFRFSIKNKQYLIDKIRTYILFS